MNRYQYSFYKTLIVLVACLLSVSIALKESYAFDSRAPFVYMYDVQSESELFSKSAHVRITPASMTKMMTSYVVMKSLEKGQVSLDDEFITSEKAYSMPGSRMFLEIGQKVSVGDLLLGLIVQSGNDASVVLAEGISGSEAEFASLMTKYAKLLGTKDTQFRNASGLPETGHYTTAYDLVMIAKALINNFPALYSLYEEKEYEFNSINQKNRNLLLGVVSGVDGIKTGYTKNSGYGVAVSAIRKERRLIFVAHGMQNKRERQRESERLIEWGFRAWSNRKIIKKQQIIYNAPVILGDKSTVNFVSEKPIYVSIPNDKSQKARIVLRYIEPIVAPIKKNDMLASLHIAIGNTERVINLFADTNIRKTGFFGTLWYNTQSLLGLKPK